MLGKIEGRRGGQRMRRLDSITDAMNMNLGKLRETVRGRVACVLQPVGSQRWTRLNIRRTSTRRGVPRLRWLEAGPALGGPREPPPSHGWCSHSHLTDRETEAPWPARGRELREGATLRSAWAGLAFSALSWRPLCAPSLCPLPLWWTVHPANDAQVQGKQQKGPAPGANAQQPSPR